jgi:hypothetical protein
MQSLAGCQQGVSPNPGQGTQVTWLVRLLIDEEGSKYIPSASGSAEYE